MCLCVSYTTLLNMMVGGVHFVKKKNNKDPRCKIYSFFAKKKNKIKRYKIIVNYILFVFSISKEKNLVLVFLFFFLNLCHTDSFFSLYFLDIFLFYAIPAHHIAQTLSEFYFGLFFSSRDMSGYKLLK